MGRSSGRRRRVQYASIALLIGLVLLNLTILHFILQSDSGPAPITPPVVKRQTQGEEVKIPRIVHLSWKDDKVPADTVKWLQQWPRTNPHWEVWFWSDSSGRLFVQRKYPHLLHVYDGYRSPIFRADAIRYLILYEYGGVWADLDVEPLKSLDSIRDSYPCILSQEPFVHARNWNVGKMVCNAFMACRPRHPYFRFLIDMLEVNQKDPHPVAATGPIMLTRMYRAYGPLFETLAGPKENQVHIAPVNMFMPTIDILALNSLRSSCKKNQVRPQHKYMCKTLFARGYRNGPDNTSFTDHHWWHSWLGKKKFDNKRPIQEVIPKVLFPDKSGKF